MFDQLKRILKDSFIYGAGSLVHYSIAFLLIPVYTRYLTPSDYGILEVITVTLSLLLILYIMGMSTAIFKSYFDTKDENSRKTIVSSALIYLSLTSLISTIILVLLAPFISSIFFGTRDNTLLFIIAFSSLFFDTGLIIPLALFRAKGEPRKYVTVSVSRFIVGMGLNILFVVVLARGVLGILMAQLITSAAFYLFLIPGIVKESGCRFSVHKLKDMLSFGLPLVPVGLGATLLTLADRYFLNFFSTTGEVGLYALGYKLGSIISGLIANPFQLAWLPFLFSIKDSQNAREVYSRVLTYFSLIAIFFALALSVLAKPVLWVMATPPFYTAYKVIPLIAFSYVLQGCYLVVAVPFYLTNRTKWLAYLVGSAALANLLLNYLLIPGYGMMGAATATFLSYAALFLAAAFTGRHYYTIPYEYGRVLKIFLAAGLVFIGSLYINSTSPLATGLLKLVSLLAFPLLLFALGFFRLEELQKVGEVTNIAVKRAKTRLHRGATSISGGNNDDKR
ncbi:MAG: oligosaccharide flippase family protein [Dehalococcoidia bacterium]|nr:oligosaccharide flippase family protein [Dehalococcoidia bacterium]